MTDISTSDGICLLDCQSVGPRCKSNCDDCNDYKQYLIDNSVEALSDRLLLSPPESGDEPSDMLVTCPDPHAANPIEVFVCIAISCPYLYGIITEEDKRYVLCAWRHHHQFAE